LSYGSIAGESIKSSAVGSIFRSRIGTCFIGSSSRFSAIK
jgi:hypothetical protein